MKGRDGRQLIVRPPGWTMGGPPPWLGATAEISLDRLRVGLAERGPGRPTTLAVDGAKESAVLAPLFDDGGVHVILTRRSEHLRDHRGEVSFPGGRLDHGETIVDAALREAAEEIALSADDVEIIGALDDVGTAVSRSLIHPVVGFLHRGRPSALRVNPDEVERVFFVPLANLVRPGVYHTEHWGSPGPYRLVHFFELDDETIWGATAGMLVNLLSIALQVADAADR